MGLALVFVVSFLILANKPPTWAQVQERFGSMPFFSASIYTRDVYWSDNPLIEPKLVEVWAGYGDRMRIRSGSKMTFIYKGEILNTFDLITRSEDSADSITYALVNILGKSHTNALDSLLMPFKRDTVPESISKEWKSGGPVDATSLVMPDSVASKDLVVFDREYFYFKSKDWMARVWVVRESRLPVRIVMWHVDELIGRWIRSPFLDMMFTYSKEQPKEFFDSEAFAAKLKDPAIGIESLLYMFHQFPGSDSFPIN
jgi:hypothetical protein